MSKIAAAVDRTVPAVSQIDTSDVRSRQSAGVLWSERGWGHVALWGVGRVGNRGQRNQLWLGACRAKVNFTRRDPLEGSTTPVFA